MYKSLIYFLLFLLVVGISLRTCSESSESDNEEYTENIEESVTSIETTKEPTILVENCDIVYDTTHKEDKSQSTTINNNLTICYGDSNLHVIEYMGYEVIFNSLLKIPILVKYELTAEETDGMFSRKGLDFCEDLKANVIQANDYDYRGSGWSRGHMAPAGDFTWSSRALRETFYYTNCCPQDLSLNTGQWKYLEEEVRDWAKRFGCITVVTGPIVGSNEHGVIGNNKIIVPDAFYKVVCNGEQAIAFVMYNRSRNESMKKCAMSVDCLEELSGLDFFLELDDEVENKIEAACILNYWNL